jgi:hypothetical protein
MNLSFIIVDRINIQKNYGDNMGLNGDNSQEVLSDTFQITQDLVNFVSTTMGQFGVQLTEDGLSTEPLFDETQDKVSGWITDMSLRLKHVNCVTPMGDVDITIPSQSNISLRYLTCDTLTGCTSFKDLREELIDLVDDKYVSGGTFNVGTSSIDFEGNKDETTFSVDLSYLTSINTDNYVYNGVYNSATESLDFTGTFSGTTFSLSLKEIEDRINTNRDLSQQNESDIDTNSTNLTNLQNNVDYINRNLITGGTYDVLTSTINLNSENNVISITGITSGGGGDANSIRIDVRNDEGTTIPLGTPLYSKGEIGGSERILVGIADNTDPNKMPVIGISTEEMDTSSTQDSEAIVSGIFNENINGFTGLVEGDIMYVNSGTLTNVKPTGENNLLQNVGIVLKTNGTTIQGLLVSAIGRTNATPNLDSGKFFLGDSGNTSQSVTMSGDISIDNTGETLIGDGKVTYPKIQDTTSQSVLGNTSTSGGTIEEIPFVEEWLVSGTITTLLENTSNWSSGVYIGTTITGTFQSQKHADGTYLFMAIDDNNWIRIQRV